MSHKTGGGHGVTGIQGQGLQLNVVGCRHLANKEWFSRQDPYVIVEYANTRFRTRTDTDGGTNPSFNEKFTIPLIEGLREINAQVWNSNTLSVDDYIGSAKVLLEKVLSTGYDDSSWPIKSKTGKTAGEVNLILHFSNMKTGKEDKLHGVANYGVGYPPAQGGYPPSGFPSTAPPTGYPSGHVAPTAYPPAHGATGYAPAPAYPAPGSYPPVQSYHSASSGYPPTSGYPPQSGYPSLQSSHAIPYGVPSGYPPVSGYPPPGGPRSASGSESHTDPYPPTSYPSSGPPPSGYPGQPPPPYGAPPGRQQSYYPPSY